MFLITQRKQFGPTTFLWDVQAPDVARAVRPGHFVMARLDEHGERIPLTVADFNARQGTVTVVIQAVGKTTIEMMTLREGDFILDFIGPLGLPSHIRELDGTVVLVGGGLGVAPVFPQLREYKNAGNRTISIVGFRNRDLMFWEDQFREFSDELIVTTDDGSYGRKGFVSHALADVLGGNQDVREVVAIGPLPMMKACCEVTRASGIPTIVSLNSIMVDGTGMCGSCRVTVDGKMKFACVDGADFDGHLVNFDELALRQKRFEHEEKAALVRYRSESAALASLKMPAESDGLPPASKCELPQPTATAPKPLVPKNLRSIPPERAPMPQQPPEVRRHNFEEVALGLDLEAALHESERCLRCKKPRCVPGCPVGIDIPGFIAALQRKDIQRSYQILKSTNALPAVCGRVCPQESQCEATCVVGAKYQPVAIGRLERFVADCAMGRGWDEVPVDRNGCPKEGGHHRFRPGRPGLRRGAGAEWRPGDHLRGAARGGRRAEVRHPGVPAAGRHHRRRNRKPQEDGGRDPARYRHRQAVHHSAASGRDGIPGGIRGDRRGVAQVRANSRARPTTGSSRPTNS